MCKWHKILIALSIFTCLMHTNTSFASPVTPSTLISCGQGKHWVKKHFRRAYVRADGTPVSATTVSAHCSSNPPGYEHWSPLIRDGRPPDWPNQTEVSTPWREEENERLLNALSSIPKEMWPALLQGFFRMKKSQFFSNPSSTDPAGSISVYDSFFDKNRNQTRILVHEFAHLLYANDLEMSRSYRTASAWFDDSPDQNQPHFVPLRKNFVEPDGDTSPSEDFANNFEYYVFDRKKLESLTPGIALWFKNQYHDKLDFQQKQQRKNK